MKVAKNQCKTQTGAKQEAVDALETLDKNAPKETGCMTYCVMNKMHMVRRALNEQTIISVQLFICFALF